MVSVSIPVVFIFISIIFSGTTLSEDQYEESQAIKTFQNEYGDVYDCVDIYKQPSLNHLLLKNHKIQMWPTSKFISEGIEEHMSKGNCSNSKVVINTTFFRINSPKAFQRKSILFPEKKETKDETSNSKKEN